MAFGLGGKAPECPFFSFFIVFFFLLFIIDSLRGSPPLFLFNYVQYETKPNQLANEHHQRNHLVSVKASIFSPVSKKVHKYLGICCRSVNFFVVNMSEAQPREHKVRFVYVCAGFFMEPTVFTDVEDHMFIAKEESFGPVMVVSKFKDG